MLAVGVDIDGTILWSCGRVVRLRNGSFSHGGSNPSVTSIAFLARLVRQRSLKLLHAGSNPVERTKNYFEKKIKKIWWNKKTFLSLCNKSSLK